MTFALLRPIIDITNNVRLCDLILEAYAQTEAQSEEEASTTKTA
jgi:hypothetical protein